MYIIKNLPVYLPLTACVIIAIMGINNNIGYEELSLKIVISIVVFYLFGMAFRSIAINFLVKILRISEKKARLIKDAVVMEGLSHSSNSAAQRSHEGGYNTSSNNYNNSSNNDELEPYMPQKY